MNPDKFPSAMRCAFAAKLPVMMWGPPGVGKSSIVRKVAGAFRKVRDIRLALLDPTDMRGIPFYNPETNSAEWAKTTLFPLVRDGELEEAQAGLERAKAHLLQEQATMAANEEELVQIKASGGSGSSDISVCMARINAAKDRASKFEVDIERIEKAIARIKEAIDSNDIVFLDEINAAPPVIQAAAYQLVLDRQIGEYRLPDGVDIVAAGNREGDKGVTFKMPTPLLNRFVHLDFDHSFNDWYDWAVQSNVHPHVIGYIKYRNDALMKFDPSSKSHGFATPRTWEFSSRILTQADRDGLDRSVLTELLKGTLGEGIALEFVAFLQIVGTLPDPLDILQGKVKRLQNNVELSAKYSLIIALGQRLKFMYDQYGGKEISKENMEKWTELADNYFLFIHDQFDDEFCVLGVRDCFKNLQLPMSKAPSFRDKFVKKYGDLVMRA